MAKPFAGSYSKLNSFEVCPKRHYEVDITGTYKEEVEPGGPLDWGNQFHKQMAIALIEKKSLPKELEAYQKWIDAVRACKGGRLYVEQKYAITRNMEPTNWFGSGNKPVWWRSIADFLWKDGTFAWAGDWKTGRTKDDVAQMTFLALCLFAHFKELQTVRTDFIWIKEDTHTETTYTRASLAIALPGLLQRTSQLEQAYNDNHFPPKPGGLCKRHCPVLSCQFHGRGST